MRGNDSNSTNNNNSARGNRRETKSQYNQDSNNNNRNNTNNNGQQSNSLYERRKQQQQQQQQAQSSPQTQTRPTQQSQQQYQQYPSSSQDYRDRSGQRYDRDRSGQRYDRDRSNQRGGQFADSSMGGYRDSYGNNRNNYVNNLGAVQFTPGQSTRDLPPIETRADPSKKFTGRCRLFVGNLPHNTSEEQVRALFEPFGEIGELFLGPKSSFAFVKMDTRQNAEAARDKLDCSPFDGRSLRVRLAAHSAAIRVKNLSPVVTNELLAYAFRYFGEIERAVVVVDDKGKSIGEGIVEYSKKQSAFLALKKCQQECFMLTSSLMPVVVEAYDQHDDDEGLPEKSANKNSIEYKEQREHGPRFAEPGTFEHSFGLKWKELYNIEKEKRERLEQDIEAGRKTLMNQIEYARVEHEQIELQNKLKQLQDNHSKLQQMKEQHMSDAQKREELRRQQDLLIRQREEEVLRRQQLSDPNQLFNQQPYIMQDMMGTTADASLLGDQQASGIMQDSDTGAFGAAMMDQPRTFADVAMMGMNQSFMQQPQQMPGPMGMAPLNQQAMFTGYIPPPPLQTDSLGNNFGSFQQATTFTIPTTEQQQQQQQQQQHQQTSTGNDVGQSMRQQKMARSYVNQGNNINVLTRPRKKGRF